MGHLEDLKRRLIAWKKDDLPKWLQDGADDVIRNLERDISAIEQSRALTIKEPSDA